MTQVKKQGNDHKVVGTQEMCKRVADVCNKYGFEFNERMLVRIEDSSRSWLFLPYSTENGTKFGIMRFDCNGRGNWHPHNIDGYTHKLLTQADFDMFDEVAEVLSATYDGEE